MSSDPGKATASVVDSTLIVTVVAEGSATITVTASDGKGDGTASVSFTVTIDSRTTIIINKETLRIEDPLNQVDSPGALRQVADVASGKIFKDKAKQETSSEKRLVDGIETVVNIIDYVIDQDSFANAVADLLTSGDVRTRLQNKLDEVTGTEDYTVRLSEEPQEDVVVRITSDQPAAFVVTPQTLTFTPDNYSRPQTGHGATGLHRGQLRYRNRAQPVHLVPQHVFRGHRPGSG
ncbi:MAG: hypothetical protein OXI08_11415 [Cyanobacteria bacterium MAG IRC4_bin_6]|nr:hypothetical protein [Cyanobacteria bacterium MAG IRC4_bin_6]